MGLPPVGKVILNHSSRAARVVAVIRDSILKPVSDEDEVSRSHAHDTFDH
jgi:hypothetical protein